MSRYVVVAKFSRKEEDGESRQHGGTIWRSYTEERAYTFTGEQTLSDVFAKFTRNMGAEPFEVRLFDDQSSYGNMTSEDDSLL